MGIWSDGTLHRYTVDATGQVTGGTTVAVGDNTWNGVKLATA
ncbi:hypothetical protein AB0C89_36195 [Streptomyces sp. NPDC048491]